MAGMWRNSVFPAFATDPSTANFTTPLAEHFSVAAHFVRGLEKADSREFHCREEIWKSQDRSGVHYSATSVSGTWLKRDMAGALGQLACSLSILGLLGLHVMCIICRCPLLADVVDQNARFLLYIDACALKGIGQTGEKIYKMKENVHREVLRPSSLQQRSAISGHRLQ